MTSPLDAAPNRAITPTIALCIGGDFTRIPFRALCGRTIPTDELCWSSLAVANLGRSYAGVCPACASLGEARGAAEVRLPWL
jgi:hypothetical protein